MALTSGKIVLNYFDKVIETYEHQMLMLDLVNSYTPSAGDLQNSGNVIWRNVQQHARIVEGFDLSGVSSADKQVIQEEYPAVLGLPQNDLWELRVDDLRDPTFWDNRAVQSGKLQATNLNQAMAQAIVDQGSIYFESNAASGFDIVGEAKTIMDERQTSAMERHFLFTSRDELKFAKDLAARQTLQGRPENDAWKKGQIGSNVAGFDIHAGSFVPLLAGSNITDTTTTATLTFGPEAGTVHPTTKVVTNIDYRTADIPVVATSAYAVGDKVTLDNTGPVPVQSIGLADKNPSGQSMTFTVVGIPDATTLTIFPKPIALDDAGLSAIEAEYANIDTQVISGATVQKINTVAQRPNIFWDRNAIELLKGEAPLKLMSDFAGMKVLQSTMSNGQTMYMIYDGNILTTNFTCRVFVWWGITIANPSACGSCVTL